MRTKTLILWLLLFVTIPSFAYDFQSGNLCYNILSENRVEVTRLAHSYSTTIVIPKSVTYDGTTYRVTSIGKYVFSNYEDIKSVTIGNNVTSIGERAFSDCTGLTSVRIGNSVTSIGDWAFENCTGLATITIPDDVTSIGDGAFNGCSSLTSIAIPNNVTSLGDFAFSDCTSLTSVTIGNSVAVLNGTFDGCSSLTSVTIGNGVKSIENWTFRGCSSLISVIWNAKWCRDGDSTPFGGTITSFTFGSEVVHIPSYLCLGMNELTSITIPNSVTSIGDYAFYNCSGLTSIAIPNSVTNIGESAFEYCYGLTKTNYTGSIADWCRINFADNSSTPVYYSHNLFINDVLVTDLIIPEGITSINNYAFCNCRNLTSVTIPNSVTSIGDHAFRNCRNLTSVTIPNSVTSIGSSAFDGCTGLTKTNYTGSIADWCRVNFANDMSNPMYWSYNLFINDVLVTDLIIPEGITKINNYAFYNCSSLTSVTIPNSVTSIGKRAFDNTGLTSVIWNAKECGNWSSAAEAPFTGTAESITAFTFGDKINHIPSYLCYGMQNLITITIPNNVTSIGDAAFSGCSGLTYVVWNARDCQGWNQYNDSPFYTEYGQSSITSFAFGNNVKSIPSYLCYGMNKLTSITIPNNVTSIGDAAFSGCSGLTSVVWNARDCQGWNQYNDSPFYTEYGQSSITSFAFGNNVKSIPSYLCYGMNKLTSITIPNNVTSIGSNAFSGCSELTKTNYTGSIADWCMVNFTNDLSNPMYWSHNLFINDVLVTDLIIPEGITKINNYAFYNCSSLTSVTIPNSVTSIGKRAFDNTGLTSVIWNANECGNWNSAAEAPFRSAVESITAFTFGDEVNHIPSYLCYGMKNLTSVTFSNRITSIGSAAFCGCTGLASVTIPNSVTSIGNAAFSGCSGLTSVIWNAKNCQGWSQYNDSPFYTENAESSITSFTFGSNVKNIPSYLCYGMNKLTSIAIPNSVTGIGSYAFSNCSRLTSVTIPSSVTSIGVGAFSTCMGLSSVTIPNSVQTIGQNAFENCKYLEEVSFGMGIENIGENAFAGDSRIYSITCYADITPTIYESTFSGVSSNAELHVLANLVKKYKVNEYWGRFTIVPIGADNTTDGTLSVNPSETDATFTWPANDNADTYTLTIQKGDMVFCTLTFDANGVLQSMRFAAPSRSVAQHTAQAQATGNGFRFVVEGLDRATTYAYSITATDKDETVLSNYSGTFTTQAPTGTEDILSTPPQPTTRKVFRNGQVYILRNDKMYNINGTEM